jgi:2-dehydropantoate 2-reductase
MRIGIVGAGGVGGYYGGVLARTGHEVHVLARGINLAALRQKGIEIRTPEESFVVQVKAADDVKQFGPVDWAIVAVKTYSLSEVAPAARYLAERGAAIVSLLNGVDIADRLIELGVPKQNIIGGLTTISAVRTGPGIFERRGKVQQVVLGEFTDPKLAQRKEQEPGGRVERIAEAFRRAGAEVRVSNDIRTDLWRKFAFIAPMAAACGLSRTSIGPIRTTSLGRLLLERGIREVISVGRAHGVPLGDEEVDRIMKFSDALPETNKPSLLVDLEAGRRTEIDDLSGAVSRMAREKGVQTPIHDTAVAAISAASAVASSSAVFRAS